MFQYFNCIGGISYCNKKIRQKVVSILQLYRWNRNLRLRHIWTKLVSILQLYRWNTNIPTLDRALNGFQYFNCIGGIIQISTDCYSSKVSILQLYRWNTKDLLPVLPPKKVSILQLYRWNLF